jgi:CRP-like cAMP-binding protein
MQTVAKTKRDFLRSVSMFERLPSQAIDRLVLSFERHELDDDSVVFRQGDRGDRMYLVETGQVDLFRNDEYGRIQRLASVETGGYFGELALLSDNPRLATARCVGQTELLSISGRELKRLLAESPPALRSLVGAVREYKPPEKPPPFWARLGRRKPPPRPADEPAVAAAAPAAEQPSEATS